MFDDEIHTCGHKPKDPVIIFNGVNVTITRLNENADKHKIRTAFKKNIPIAMHSKERSAVIVRIIITFFYLVSIWGETDNI